MLGTLIRTSARRWPNPSGSDVEYSLLRLIPWRRLRYRRPSVRFTFLKKETDIARRTPRSCCSGSISSIDIGTFPELPCQSMQGDANAFTLDQRTGNAPVWRSASPRTIAPACATLRDLRSEERRVGKEC